LLPLSKLTKCFTRFNLTLNECIAFECQKKMIEMIFLCCLWQPCGHSGIYTKCVRQIYLCPNCFKVITNASVVVLVKQPTLGVWLKPLGLVQAFNSIVILKVQCKRSNWVGNLKVKHVNIIGWRQLEKISFQFWWWDKWWW
jgi:hypothetical protein